MSLEFSKPLQIDDDDCDVRLPTIADDHVAFDAQQKPSITAQSDFLGAIKTARCAGRLRKALRNPIVEGPTLATFDDLFASCALSFSSQARPHSSQQLEPESLPTLIFLQNSRLVLDRHNLSACGSPDVRSAAVDRCVATARDTARLFARVIDFSPSPTAHDSSAGRSSRQSRLTSVASTPVCMHIWRCTLFLVFRGHYSEAMTLVRAAATIGKQRSVNPACGRQLAFFVDTITEKLARGERYGLQMDEELLIYASGDMQGESESAWAWREAQIGGPGDAIVSPVSQSSDVSRRGSSNMPSPQLAADGVDGGENWSGWEQIISGLQALQDEQRGQILSGPAAPSPSLGPRSSMPPPPPQQQQSQTSRISIANII